MSFRPSVCLIWWEHDSVGLDCALVEQQSASRIMWVSQVYWFDEVYYPFPYIYIDQLTTYAFVLSLNRCLDCGSHNPLLNFSHISQCTAKPRQINFDEFVLLQLKHFADVKIIQYHLNLVCLLVVSVWYHIAATMISSSSHVWRKCDFRQYVSSKCTYTHTHIYICKLHVRRLCRLPPSPYMHENKMIYANAIWWLWWFMAEPKSVGNMHNKISATAIHYISSSFSMHAWQCNDKERKIRCERMVVYRYYLFSV